MPELYTDQQIIDAFRAGGPAREGAWKHVYIHCRGKVIQAIVARGGTREEALEALQDVAVSFEARVRRQDFDLRHKLSTYLVTCVYHRWLRVKQKEKDIRTEEMNDPDIAGFAESIEKDIIDGELADVVDSTLTRIGERCKTILVYFYYEGFSMKEIAARMGFKNEQVAKNAKSGCLSSYKAYLRQNRYVLQSIKELRNAR